MNCYNHFTIKERCCLREYYIKGKSYREIAKLLGRNVSSVSRELRRNCTFYRDVPRYYQYTAQKKSNLRNSYRHQGVFCDRKVLDYIEEKLSLTWSPEQIANSSCEFKLPSFKTIYRWLYEGYICNGNVIRSFFINQRLIYASSLYILFPCETNIFSYSVSIFSDKSSE